MSRKKKSLFLKSLKKRWRRALSGRWIFKLLLAFVVVLTLFVIHLYMQVTTRFEARRWNLPSRIYSDSVSLFDGLPLTQPELDEKLANLNYRAVVGVPKSPGEFVRTGLSYQVYLHDFDYPHEKFTGSQIKFTLTNNRLANLTDTNNAPVALANLEPELIASIFDEDMEDRTVVSLDKVPKELAAAVIAIEDERFYHHFGIDPIGIVRAFVADLRAMSMVQGGSTLTQQLAKNFFLHSHKTIGRKVTELFMAVIMEMRYTKTEILEAYLNEIYFGQRGAASISGVQEAARFYFSKDVGQLDLSECATLAGMIRSPGGYSPFRNPDRARERRDVVLGKMHDEKIITDAAYQLALKEPMPKMAARHSTNAPYFVEFVKAQLKESFNADILTSEGLRIFTTLDMSLQRTAETTLSTHLDRLEKDFPKLKANADKGEKLEGALLAVQPGTGFIKAYVAGRNYNTVQFDHITLAKRQPGSTFKPFVYLTALEGTSGQARFTLSSILPDEPLTLKNSGQSWKPDNYDNSYHGKVRLRTALEHSYNVATVWLGDQVGFDNVADTARQAGITSILEPYPSLALGAFEVTPMELAMAYTVFPGQGIKAEPVAIRRVVTREGQVLEKKGLDLKPVFDADVIYLMNRLLKGVIDEGTAASARKNGLTVLAAGKTGTTSNTKDAWFVGYTPNILALTWVGYDDNTTTGLTGASGALPIWTDFMKIATTGETDTDFTPTTDIVITSIDTRSGLLYDVVCTGSPLDEYFIEGAVPYEYCSEALPDDYDTQ